MTVKELIRRLKRYPGEAEVGVANIGGSSFVEGDIETRFSVRQAKRVPKCAVGSGFEDTLASCDVVIEV